MDELLLFYAQIAVMLLLDDVQTKCYLMDLHN